MSIFITILQSGNCRKENMQTCAVFLRKRKINATLEPVPKVHSGIILIKKQIFY